MSGSTNFKVFDENKTNMLDDTEYYSATKRIDGNISGIAESILHNKLYYQCSVFVAALAAALANQGQTVTDNSFSALTSLFDIVFKRLWHPETEYVVGDVVFCLSSSGYKYAYCTTPGTTNTTEPTLGALATTVIDGSVIWTVGDIKALPLAGGTMLGAIAMNSNKITGLAPGTNNQDAVNYLQLINSGVPIGTALPYAGFTAPSGFLMCDGSAVSRTIYANLYAIIGTTYGVGDGSTTFNVPPLNNRVPVGKGNAFLTLGATGGEISHVLTVPEIPSHQHIGPFGCQSTLPYGVADNNYTHTGSGDTDYDNRLWYTSATGGGLSHNNLQPYVVMNYIIRY